MAFRDWFTTPKEREERSLRELYGRVAECERAHPPNPREIVRKVMNSRWDDFALPEELEPAVEKLLLAVLKTEPILNPLPPFDAGPNVKTSAELTNHLVEKEYFFHNQEKIEALVEDALRALFFYYNVAAPKMHAPSPFTIPLYGAVIQPRDLIDKSIGHLYEKDLYDRGVFRNIVHKLYANICMGSDHPIQPPTMPARKKLIFANESKKPLHETVATYLGGTPFQQFFETKIPLQLAQDERFNHWHILGGTGAGKTTLLENLILHDLKGEWPTPSLVVVDAHGDLIRKILRYDEAFNPRGGRFTDELILISPKDTKYPPAINIFDTTRLLLSDYDEATKEQVTAGVIQTFDYLFTGLLGADLTAKQGVFFKMVARLMLTIPEAMGRMATILDMMRLMEDAKPYQAAIDILPPLQREFFEKDFGNNKVFGQTKDQIRYRLQAILENPTMARLFTSERSRINFFSAINRSSIILVDTAKDFLKGASANFGKVIISLVLQAVMERAAISEKQRRPVYLIIDEAAEYFDSNIDDLLTEARKYKCGIILAHQYLEQASSGLRASLAANTGIKFAGGVSNADARAMATNMRTSPEFILDQPRLSFAAHIRNVTPQAVSIPVEVGRFEKERRMTDADMKTLMALNRERTSFGPPEIAEPNRPTTPGATSPPRTVTPAAPEDISDEW